MSKAARILSIVVLLSVAGLNAITSQNFPSLLFDLVDANSPRVARAFLAQIQSSNEYGAQYSLFDSMFHESISQDIEREHGVIIETIQTLEKAKELSPKNPVVLSALAHQYGLIYDTKDSDQYQNRAHEIDPLFHPYAE